MKTIDGTVTTEVKSMNANARNSLYIALTTVTVFLFAIVMISSSQPSTQLENTDRVYAGAVEPREATLPPIGGSEEMTTVAPKTPTTRPTATTIVKTSSPSATPVPTLEPTLEPTPIPTIVSNTVTSPTEPPPFDLNLPGDTTTTVATPAPVVQARAANNLPLIIGVIVGVLLIVGGLVVFLLKRRSKPDDFVPQAGPMSAPPSFTPPNQVNGMPNAQQTPYDQYMNNQPGNGQNQ